MQEEDEDVATRRGPKRNRFIDDIAAVDEDDEDEEDEVCWACGGAWQAVLLCAERHTMTLLV